MVPGTSFPSAHVAAMVVLMWDLRLAVSMTAGTVLLFFHSLIMGRSRAGIVTTTRTVPRVPRTADAGRRHRVKTRRPAS